MTKDKIFVYDLPRVITQKFKVSGLDKYQLIVERKEVIQQIHNVICSDDMKDGDVRISVDYEVWIKDVGNLMREKAIRVVEEELKKEVEKNKARK